MLTTHEPHIVVFAAGANRYALALVGCTCEHLPKAHVLDTYADIAHRHAFELKVFDCIMQHQYRCLAAGVSLDDLPRITRLVVVASGALISGTLAPEDVHERVTITTPTEDAL